MAAFNREYRPIGINDLSIEFDHKNCSLPIYTKYKGLTNNFLQKLGEGCQKEFDDDGNICAIWFYKDGFNPASNNENGIDISIRLRCCQNLKPNQTNMKYILIFVILSPSFGSAQSRLGSLKKELNKIHKNEIIHINGVEPPDLNFNFTSPGSLYIDLGKYEFDIYKSSFYYEYRPNYVAQGLTESPHFLTISCSTWGGGSCLRGTSNSSFKYLVKSKKQAYRFIEIINEMKSFNCVERKKHDWRAKDLKQCVGFHVIYFLDFSQFSREYVGKLLELKDDSLRVQRLGGRVFKDEPVEWIPSAQLLKILEY